MNFNTVALILFIVFAVIAVIAAIKSVADDIRTQEGCAGCNGVCTTNGGYCPRRRDHKPRPQQKMLWEMSGEGAGAGNMKTRVIAVCCNNQSKVTSFGKMRYMMLYIVNRRGISSKKLLSLADIPQDRQIAEMKKNRVNVVLAARVLPEEQEKLREEGMILSICYEREPDQVIDTFFESSLQRVQVKDIRLLSMIVRRMKESYKSYPDAPLATALRWLSTTVIYASVVIAVACIVVFAAGHTGNVLYGTFFVTVMVQAAACGVFFKSEDLAKKKHPDAQKKIGVNP